MIEDWINVLQEKNYTPQSIEDIWNTHQLCENILNKALLSNS